MSSQIDARVPPIYSHTLPSETKIAYFGLWLSVVFLGFIYISHCLLTARWRAVVFLKKFEYLRWEDKFITCFRCCHLALLTQTNELNFLNQIAALVIHPHPSVNWNLSNGRCTQVRAIDRHWIWWPSAASQICFYCPDTRRESAWVRLIAVHWLPDLTVLTLEKKQTRTFLHFAGLRIIY